MASLRTLTTLAALISLVLAEPQLSRSVVHEKRSAIPNGWTRLERHAADAVMSMRFGLRQRNLDRIEEFLLDVSHPDSPNYGNHWTAGKIAATFAPSQETVDTVQEWLGAADIHPNRVKVTSGKVWLELNATTAEAEKLLSTQYHVYGHESGVKHVACEKYHLPEHVSPHIEIITPSIHFDVQLGKRGASTQGPSAGKLGAPGAGTVVPVEKGKLSKILDELENCHTYTTPNCLRALYGIVYPGPLAADKNSYGIVEYTPQAYLQSDLDLFFTNFSTNLKGIKPKLISIDGGSAQTDFQGFDYNGESDLDLEYGQALVGKQPITLYQAGDWLQGASFNNFLDAIDGSYCSFEGGDDPNLDGIFPDPYGTADQGAYQGKEDCGIVKPAYTISTSYGYDEAQLSPAYAARQCAEYAKLGLMGTTILYSSGDNGVAGNSAVCLDGNHQESWFGTVFNPGFPSSCPYVTAIGATQLPANAKVTDKETAVYETIYSGGGFSNYFPIPDYQKSQVTSYLESFPPPYASPTVYNATGRGFPDISANGANYVVAVNGAFYTVFGTSASSPVVGAMITNINDARLAIGKKPLGFINPALYSSKFQDAFNDIVSGTNPGCGTDGFNATKGWDPVTGLGTPKFPVLLAKFLAL